MDDGDKQDDDDDDVCVRDSLSTWSTLALALCFNHRVGERESIIGGIVGIGLVTFITQCTVTVSYTHLTLPTNREV